VASPSGRPVRIGLVVNPIAGIGGRVGLKGSDGAEIVERALALGAVPQAGARTVRALARLRSDAPAGSFELLVAPGPMGADPARAAGVPARVVGELPPTAAGVTTAEDTRRIARSLVEGEGVDVLLFGGGDGTAADVLVAVGSTSPVIGIPAGVKIHSSAFAVTPGAAGALAAMLARGTRLRDAEAEVLDLDEDAYRRGEVAPRLVGYLRVPQERRLLQARKAPSPAGEVAALEAIAADVVEGMEPGRGYILGPGTTVRAVAERLGVAKTLVGVDAVRDGALVATDAAEDDLLALASEGPIAVVVTPIGGQGFIFGRGNQQIGPAVLRRAGRERVIVVATPWKLASLGGRPLRVDTGDPEVDAWLAGHLRVTTGYGDRAMCRVVA
jgi:predicted polyphosphate/ATP-dependent NAD kinase